MITKFDSLYAGQVDLEDIGYGGTPINDRLYDNAHLSTALGKVRAMAQLMDRLGYSTFWMAEHHFQREGTECIPNVLLMALHLTHVTQTMKIGCGFNIVPMWHPLRLAEDYAMADILSKAYPGLDRISVSLSVGVPEALALEQLERFAKEVMPAFKNAEIEVKAEPALAG